MEHETKKKIETVCVACGRKEHVFYTKKNGHDVWRCLFCKTLFLYPLPKSSETEAVYGKEYFAGGKEGFGYVDYDADKEAMRAVFEKYLTDFVRILGKTGRLLDIGAATGYFMRIAETKGWKVHGIEISAYAAELGKSRGLDIETGTVHQTTFAKESFDLVTMWDVVEHMPDPILDIKKIRTLIKPNGLVAINTPDSGSLFARILGSRWHLFVPPEHIFYFNRNSLRMLLERNGFEVLEVGCVGKRFTVEYIMHTLSRWQNLGIWKKLLGFLERHPRIGQWSLPVNLWDNMYMLARKVEK
jgi:SAM-dependent methyltransferase